MADIKFLASDIAALLMPLKIHTLMTKAELKKKALPHLNEENDYEEVYIYVIDEGYIEERGFKKPVKNKNLIGVRLTASGREWLDYENSESTLDVEDEDSGSVGGPVKPYEVSKLDMEQRPVSIFQALRKIEKGEIDLNPEFQRAFVWDEVKQSRLIESVLIRIPLPAFYLDATNQTNWSVVDGLQRLTTLNKFCRKEDFALNGLQFLSELEGMRFSDLPKKYQVLIEDDTQLLFYNLMPGTPVEAKFTIFSRVNTGGMQLTSQEIRHALSQGPVTKELLRLSKSSSFKNATQGAVESLRMSDRELILRALAFMHFGIDAYKDFNELDGFLMAAMKSLNELPQEELKELTDDFLQSVDKVYSIFGKYAFRKYTARGARRSPFNKALFETWVNSVRPYSKKSLLSNKNGIMDAFAELVNFSSTYVRSISSSTGSATAVLVRFSAIEELLSEVIS